MKIREILNEGKSVANLNLNYADKNFIITHRDLTSLKGTPKNILGNFDCSFNNLINLIDGPKFVQGHYYCHNNKLKSLEGCIEDVLNSFDCGFNLLEDLNFGPKNVKNNYYCTNNKLISLKGAPIEILGHFNCSYNNLTTLKYAPKIIGNSLWCRKNNISTFKNIFEYIHEIRGGGILCAENPIKEGLLHILLIKGIKRIFSPFEEINKIINEYLKTNKSGSPKAMFDVQKLIIEAKLKDIPESVYME